MVRVRKISKTDPDLNRFIFKILQNWQKHRDAPRVLKARVVIRSMHEHLDQL